MTLIHCADIYCTWNENGHCSIKEVDINNLKDCIGDGMKPTETKNLSWKDAWWHLLNGKKIKRPLWEGYWAWENGTIMMHCRDGEVTDIRNTDFVAYTFSNIAQRDWMVVEE